MLEKTKMLVHEILKADSSGHGYDHVTRVYNLALKFAQEENANTEIVALAALLHDVDDYKLFGKENAENLTNAKKILKEINVDINTQESVLEIIRNMGYSKLLKGIRPSSIEGKIVSDADMCDAMGVTGILRTYAYNNAHGHCFFDRNIFPILDMDSEQYKNSKASTAVCHIFEKILRLRKLMFTEAAKKEAICRETITIDFLKHFFIEENANEWLDYLDNYLRRG